MTTKENDVGLRKRKEERESPLDSPSFARDADKLKTSEGLRRSSLSGSFLSSPSLRSFSPPLSPSLLARRLSISVQQNPRGWFFWSALFIIFIVTYVLWSAANPSVSTGTTPYSLPPLLRQHLEKGEYIPIYVDSPCKVFVRQEGPYDGPAVLLINSFPASSFVNRDVLGLLANDGLRAISFDLPGLGLSDKPAHAPYTWDYLSSTILGVVESLQLSSVHLVLQDIAGPIGTDFAAKHPHRVKSVTYLNAPFNLVNSTRPLLQRLYLTPNIGRYIYSAATHALTSPLMWALLRFKGSDTLTFEEFKAYNFLNTYGDNGAAYNKMIANFNFTAEYTAHIAQSLQSLNASGIPVQMVWATREESNEGAQQASYLDKTVYLRYISYVDSKALIQEDTPVDLSSRVSVFVREIQPPTVHSHAHDHDHAGHDHSHHDHHHHHHDHAGHAHSHEGHDHHHGYFGQDYGLGGHVH